MAKTKTKQKWFINVRYSYLPASAMGLLVYMMYMAYLVALVADWLRDGHHVWYLLVNVIPLSVAAAVLTQYIAYKHSS
jgi:hypothetical protein